MRVRLGEVASHLYARVATRAKGRPRNVKTLLPEIAPGGTCHHPEPGRPSYGAFVTRTGEASFETTQPWDTLAPRVAHFPEPSRFHF